MSSESEAPVEGSLQNPPAGWYPDVSAPGTQRYWDGSAWIGQPQWLAWPQAVGVRLPGGETGPLSTTRISQDERKLVLAQQIRWAAASNRRVESQTDFQAVLLFGQPVNHTLHAILMIFTCLLWGIAWAIITASGGERREMIVVDEFGNVTHQQLGKVR